MSRRRVSVNACGMRGGDTLYYIWSGGPPLGVVITCDNQYGGGIRLTVLSDSIEILKSKVLKFPRTLF
jgi:hypothetical protein